MATIITVTQTHISFMILTEIDYNLDDEFPYSVLNKHFMDICTFIVYNIYTYIYTCREYRFYVCYLNIFTRYVATNKIKIN